VGYPWVSLVIMLNTTLVDLELQFKT
jgi:hypothetical protein